MKLLLFVCFIGTAVSFQNECENMSCFTVYKTELHIVLTCRMKIMSSNMIVYDPLGNKQADCGGYKHTEDCSLKPGKHILFDSKLNELVLKLDTSQNIPEGRWVCRQDTEQLILDFHTSEGMLKFISIGLKITITPIHKVYIFKLECFSCWPPFGDHVEFYNNVISLDEMRRFRGMCFHSLRTCNPAMCRCCTNSNRFTLEDRTSDLSNIQFLGCKMRFKDSFTNEMRSFNVTMPFNERSYFGNGSEAKVFVSEAFSVLHQEKPSGGTESIGHGIDKPVHKVDGNKHKTSDVSKCIGSVMMILASIIVQCIP